MPRKGKRNHARRQSKPQAAKRLVQRTIPKQKLSDYLYAASLIDPWRFGETRIPDDRTFPSFTARSIYRITANAVPAQGSSTLYAAGVRFNVSGLGSTTPLATLGTGTGAGTFTFSTAQFDWINKTYLTTNASQARIVSASISCFPSTSYMNNKGSMYMACADQISQIGGGDFNFASYSAQAFARKCPVAMGHACSVNYWPFSPSAYEYLPTNSTTNTGQLSVVLYGCDSTATLEVSVVCNWELIPNVSASGSIAVRPSRCSNKAMEIAANAMGADKMFATFEQDVFRIQNSLSANVEQPENDGVLARIASWLKSQDPDSTRKAVNAGVTMFDWYSKFATGSMGISGAGLPSLQY